MKTENNPFETAPKIGPEAVRENPAELKPGEAEERIDPDRELAKDLLAEVIFERLAKDPNDPVIKRFVKEAERRAEPKEVRRRGVEEGIIERYARQIKTRRGYLKTPEELAASLKKGLNQALEAAVENLSHEA